MSKILRSKNLRKNKQKCSKNEMLKERGDGTVGKNLLVED